MWFRRLLLLYTLHRFDLMLRGNWFFDCFGELWGDFGVGKIGDIHLNTVIGERINRIHADLTAVHKRIAVICLITQLHAHDKAIHVDSLYLKALLNDAFHVGIHWYSNFIYLRYHGLACCLSSVFEVFKVNGSLIGNLKRTVVETADFLLNCGGDEDHLFRCLALFLPFLYSGLNWLFLLE